MKHYLTNINIHDHTADCSECGEVRIFSKGFRYLKDGGKKRRWACGNVEAYRSRHAALRLKARQSKNPRKIIKALRCTNCDFESQHSFQFDIDHIVPLSCGGTNVEANLRGVCLNCHRYKSVVIDPQIREKYKEGASEDELFAYATLLCS